LEETPRIFHVNWFRKDANGKYLWPGYGENMRVLRWIVERANGRAFSRESPLGWLPRYQDIDWRGLDYSKAQWDELMGFDRPRTALQTLAHEELFISLFDHLPKEMIFERELLLSRL